MKPGDIIEGKYRIENELGRGSFGGVYRARQTTIDRLVAIKVLQPRGKVDEEMKQRFKREAKLSSHLNSPHAIRIYDFGETAEQKMYIVMEYLEGMPLDKLLRQEGPMPVARVTNLVQQVLDSLKEAHKLGIVHRDLKPDNIFVCNNATQTDFVKVFDFGIAKVITGGQGGTLKETAKLTMIGGTVGTPAYMSPEQCCGEPLTPATDLYSLGIVVYELLTGILPFEDSNPVRTMMRQINDMPDDLPPEIANTPIGRACFKALAKKPEDRFESAEAFLDALEEEEEEEEPTANVDMSYLQAMHPSAQNLQVQERGLDTMPEFTPPKVRVQAPPAHAPIVPAPVAAAAEPEEKGSSILFFLVIAAGALLVGIFAFFVYLLVTST